MSHRRPAQFRVVPLLVAAVLVTIAAVGPATAFASVSVTRAAVSSGTLTVEGRATARRTITVDGVAMGTSDRRGTFRVSRSSYQPPADCTIDVNDGSATPAVAPLSGCTVASTPPPAPAPAPLDFVPETGSFQLGGEVGQYVIPLEVGVFANRWFYGSGGVLPYRWSVSAGALPPGMQLIQDDPNGDRARIGGTPTTAGTYTFTIRLADAAGASTSHPVSMTISDGTVLPGTSGLTSLTLSPSTVVGGTSTTATVVLGAPAPAGGAFTSVVSSNRGLAAATGDSVTVPAGATTATVPISTSAVTTTSTVTISGNYGGVTRSATLTLTPGATSTPTTPTEPTTSPDSVSIGRAEYESDKRSLRVEATSNRSGVTLRAYNTSTGALIGTLSGGGGTFSVSSNPGSVTVKSSGGGSATRTVTVK